MRGRRQKIGVTFRDLENLTRILERQPITIAAAASLLSVQRAYLYRLIDRINKIIGDPPPQWRQKEGLVLPVEVRRLVRAYRVFHDSRDDLVRFPRVSAGSSAALLLSAYLAKVAQKPGRLMIGRSRGAAEALRSESIDVVLAHERSLGGAPAEGLEFWRLLPWSSVVVRPRDAEGSSKVSVAWEPGSLGAQLNAAHGDQSAATIMQATSFLHALELARLGFVENVVLPDIYVSEALRRELIVERPAEITGDHLVALFRSADRRRLEWLLDTAMWKDTLASASNAGDE